MKFYDHHDLTSSHAFLGASKNSWLRYSPERMAEAYLNEQKKQEGTYLHEFAHEAITNQIKLARSKKTLNTFVNDAIGFRMSSEIVLFYSPNCFGTADAISFEKNVLRIHDMKTGEKEVTHFDQLMIYAALFCLEYEIDPKSLRDITLRIYQYGSFTEFHPEAPDILSIQHQIRLLDNVIETTATTYSERNSY
jgi:hypothetical protein